MHYVMVIIANYLRNVCNNIEVTCNVQIREIYSVSKVGLVCFGKRNSNLNIRWELLSITVCCQHGCEFFILRFLLKNKF